VIPNLQADAVNELANQDHEAEEVLPTTPNVIFLEGPPPPQITRVSKGSKTV
jgi:hypothetical protein